MQAAISYLHYGLSVQSCLTCTIVEYAYFFFYSLVRGAYIRRLAQRAAKSSTTGAVAVAAAAPAISTAAELLLGALAGALAQIFTIPVSVIATRQQLGRAKFVHPHSPPSSSVPAPRSPSEVSSEKPAYSAVADPRAPDAAPVAKKVEREVQDNSFLGVARAIIRDEGVTGLWLGLKPSLVLTANPAITYGAFERLKTLLLAVRPVKGGRLTPGQAFVIGALSKTLATIVRQTMFHSFTKTRTFSVFVRRSPIPISWRKCESKLARKAPAPVPRPRYPHPPPPRPPTQNHRHQTAPSPSSLASCANKGSRGGTRAWARRSSRRSSRRPCCSRPRTNSSCIRSRSCALCMRAPPLGRCRCRSE